LANNPTAEVLHALQLFLLCWIIVYASLVLPLYPQTEPISAISCAFAVLASLSALILLRRGLLLAASWVYLAAIWLETTVEIALNGGINNGAVVYYIALPISAAWLLGFRASLWSAGFCLGCSLVLALMEGNGLQVPRYFPEPFRIWICVVQATVISALPVARILQILREEVVRFASDQKALQEHQERLEEIVRRRTVELIPARDPAQAANRIEVQSVVGEGFLFRVELPMERVEEFTASAAREPRERIIKLAPGQAECRILIVEDRAEKGRLLECLLQGAGFHVRVAEDGERGIEMLQTWRPQLIWMDVRPQDMGDLETVRRIRNLDGGRDARIVALTASASTSQRAEVLAAGLDDCLQKPYRREEIFDCMARLLGIRYRYDECAPLARPEPMTVPAPGLAALPESLRGELEDALISLDIERIARVVRRISDRDLALGELLARRADTFAFTPILHALAACKGDVAAGRA
jgi:CheY-like chemotaxis protein